MKLYFDFKASLWLFALPFLFSTPAAADELTAGDLYSFCSATDQVASTACRYYVLGVVQGVEIGDGAYMGANRQLVERKKTILCLPENTPHAQMVSKQLFAVHPDDKKLPAATTVIGVMVLKFSCPK